MPKKKKENKELLNDLDDLDKDSKEDKKKEDNKEDNNDSEDEVLDTRNIVDVFHDGDTEAFKDMVHKQVVSNVDTIVNPVNDDMVDIDAAGEDDKDDD